MSVLNCTNKNTNLHRASHSPNELLSVFGRTTLHGWIPATATLEQGVLMKNWKSKKGIWAEDHQMKQIKVH